ncbi:MAG: endonuclease/exonuclease/phosphatase family protein [Candidatus Coatesbacteria bacterium]|nr:MAG: endonuclease/exonuclease/phosphatase family protein [Candidatus Coatesbacteria bacterium]
MRDVKPVGERPRVAGKLIALRDEIKKQCVPPRTASDTLLLATWNVREFGRRRPKYGRRIPESFYYIAETISAFDIVALQEVNEDLRDLKKVMGYLGHEWDFIATDITEGRSGNRERMTFVYDTRKVSFQNVAGEIVLPETKLVAGEKQFSRTPFVVAFQSGWFKFKLCTVHIYYGTKTGVKFERRVKEIKKIGEFMAKRAKEDDEYNYVLLGDFNIVSPECETMYALEGSGFKVPDEVRHPTNIDENYFYDQIAFKTKEDELRLGDNRPNAGIFKFYEAVFADDEFDAYKDYIKEKETSYTRYNPEKRKKYYRTWRTFQMSDHYPLWIELKIDFTRDYLDGFKG